MGGHRLREAGPCTVVSVLGTSRGRTGNMVPHLNFIFQFFNHVKESRVVKSNRLILKVEY